MMKPRQPYCITFIVLCLFSPLVRRFLGEMSEFKCVYTSAVASAHIEAESKPLAQDDAEEDVERLDPYKRDHWSRGAEFLFSCIAMFVEQV
jgi:hypothetical protein